MRPLTHKVIVYDSNCKVCSSLRDAVLRFTAIPPAKVKAYTDLPPDLSKRVDPNKFKNVMALVDTSGGSTIYGAEGVAYIFSSQYKVVDFLLRFKPFFRIFSFLYKTQAYNRYIIATPKSKFQCDCFPDKVIKYRLAYIVLTLILSVLLTLVFGVTLKGFFPGVSAEEAALQMLLMAGSGWVVQITLSAILIPAKALDYVGHLGSIMVTGLLILVPWMVFHAITGILTPYFPAASVLLSSACMLYLHIQRVRYLSMSQAWTIVWFLMLQCTAIFWIYYFHLT